VTQYTKIIVVILVTPKGGTKHELMLNKQSSGQNLSFLVFNSRSDRMQGRNEHCFVTKLPSLMLKTLQKLIDI
jgi:hypothetical protein